MTQALKVNFNDNWDPKYLYIFASLLSVALITTNIIAFKFITIGGLKFGAGTLLFPLCLILGDIISEVYGYKKSRKLILISLFGFFVYTLFVQLAVHLPPAPEWSHQEAFATVFNYAPRLFIAGALAYLAGELTNSYVLTKIKVQMAGRHFWWRAIASTVVGETANTTTFMLIAFLGKMEISFLLIVIFNGIWMKTLIEILVLPLTTLLVKKLKAKEGIEHFDAKPLEPVNING
jgi:hypothetical protein